MSNKLDRPNPPTTLKQQKSQRSPSKYLKVWQDWSRISYMRRSVTSVTSANVRETRLCGSFSSILLICTLFQNVVLVNYCHCEISCLVTYSFTCHHLSNLRCGSHQHLLFEKLNFHFCNITDRIALLQPFGSFLQTFISFTFSAYNFYH